jgi:hypothetical protein
MISLGGVWVSLDALSLAGLQPAKQNIMSKLIAENTSSFLKLGTPINF